MITYGVKIDHQWDVLTQCEHELMPWIHREFKVCRSHDFCTFWLRFLYAKITTVWKFYSALSSDDLQRAGCAGVYFSAWECPLFLWLECSSSGQNWSGSYAGKSENQRYLGSSVHLTQITLPIPRSVLRWITQFLHNHTRPRPYIVDVVVYCCCNSSK